MKSVIWARVSSKEQESGYSLSAQEKLLKDYAEKKELKVFKVFSIAESASGHSQRKIFDAMIQYCTKRKVNNILCEKTDRLTRRMKDAVLINEWMEKNPERKIHFVKEGDVLHSGLKSDKKFIWNIKASTAQFYTDNLSEEVRKGQLQKLQEGGLPTGPPVGYRTATVESRKMHLPDDDVAPLITHAFQLYSTGNFSLQKLIETMHGEGLRTRRGRKIGKSAMHAILTNRFYYGEIVWNGEIYQGRHKPLIQRELFDQVQKVLNGGKTPKYSRHNYLFKGLLRCAECGGVITWEEHKGHRYGHCNGYRACGQKTWVKEPDIDKEIAKHFDKLTIKSPKLAEWIKQSLKETHRDESEYRTHSLSELEKQHQKILRKMDLLYEDRLDGRISEDIYDKKHRECSEECEKIVNKIDNHSKDNAKRAELGLVIFDISQKAREFYEKKTDECKRELIRFVCEKITLDEGKLSIKYTKAFEILAGAIKETNSSKVAKTAEKSENIFEPVNFTSKEAKNRSLQPVCSTWYPGQDLNL